MPQPSIIAIDGPAGSGKSTVSERIAQRFGYIFLDTGAFYRAITYVVLKSGVAVEDQEAVAAIVQNLKIDVQPDAVTGYRVVANGEDVTDHLRTKTVENAVSSVSKIPLVRAALLPMQRQVAAQGSIIMAGRDIGTIVLPHADLKIFIDASLKERAQRRYQQAGGTASLADIEKAMEERDRIDSQRSHAPLTQAHDAIYILTDHHTLEEVVQQISDIIENWHEREQNTSLSD